MDNIGIHSAASNGDIETLVDLLSEDSKLINDVNQFGMTPLHGAVFHGQIESARILLDYGADPNHPSSGVKYTFPLHLATSRLHKPLIELLIIDGGADPAAKDYLGHTVLDVAQSISVENDSVAKDPDTNIQMANFIKSCIVKAAQSHQSYRQKSFVFESKHIDSKLGIVLFSESASDAGDYNSTRIDEEIKESVMYHNFKSGIL
jgi:hypothetical protein